MKTVSDSVSEIFGIEKVSESVSEIIRYQKKVLDSVSEIFGIKTSLGFSIKKKSQKSLGFLCFKNGFVKFGIGIGIGLETFPIWYRKKYQIRYCKYLVSEKCLRFCFVWIFGIVTHRWQGDEKSS